MTAPSTLRPWHARSALVGDSNRLHIETIRVRDLYAFACDFLDSADGQEMSPITKHRALSQTKNPYADGDEVALLVAFVGGQCVGYQGLMPVRFATPAGTTKVFWCTAMYVHPEHRNRMVAVHLVRRLVTLKQDCVLNEFADAAGRLCAAIGFRPLRSCAYLDLRFDRLECISLPFRGVRKLGRRYRVCRKIGELGVRASEPWLGPLKRWIYGRLERRGREALRGITRTEVTRVRPPDDYRSPKGVRFVRDADAVNWTLEWPWILEGSQPTRPPYYFADVSPLFRNHAVEIFGPAGRYRGFIVLTVMKPYDRLILKLRDFELGEQGYEELLFHVVMDYAGRYNVDRLELPIFLESWVRKEVPFAPLVVRRKERPYLFYPGSGGDSPLARAVHEITPSLSDGDTAFW